MDIAKCLTCGATFDSLVEHEVILCPSGGLRHNCDIVWNAEAEVQPTDDLVVRPAHYTQFAIEPVTFIMINGLPFWLGNVIKYGMRAGSKKYDDLSQEESEIRDLKKAARYLEMRIRQLEGEAVL